MKRVIPLSILLVALAFPGAALAAEPTPTPKPLPIKGVTVDVREMERGAAPPAANHIERPPMMRQFRAPAAKSAPQAPMPTPTPTPTPTPGRGR